MAGGEQHTPTVNDWQIDPLDILFAMRLRLCCFVNSSSFFHQLGFLSWLLLFILWRLMHGLSSCHFLAFSSFRHFPCAMSSVGCSLILPVHCFVCHSLSLFFAINFATVVWTENALSLDQQLRIRLPKLNTCAYRLFTTISCQTAVSWSVQIWFLRYFSGTLGQSLVFRGLTIFRAFCWSSGIFLKMTSSRSGSDLCVLCRHWENVLVNLIDWDKIWLTNSSNGRNALEDLQNKALINQVAMIGSVVTSSSLSSETNLKGRHRIIFAWFFSLDFVNSRSVSQLVCSNRVLF